MQDHYFLIFSGVNDRAIYALARALKACGEKFVIVALGNNDKIFYGKYKKHVCSMRSNNRIDCDVLKHHIIAVRDHIGDAMLTIIPTSEFLNNFFLLNRDFVENTLGCHLPLVDRTLYSTLTNKWTSTEFFLSKGIKAPKYCKSHESLNLPFVAKPIENICAGNRTRYPFIIRTTEQLNRFFEESTADQYFFQEFIHGSSYYLLSYFSRDGKIFLTSQKNIAQQPDGKSIVLSDTADFHKQSVCNRIINVLKSSGFFGFAMLEFICNSDGAFFIELNPRPWGPLSLCYDHRCGILEAFIGDWSKGNSIEYQSLWRQKPEKSKYLWLGGIAQTLYSGGKLIWKVAGIHNRFFRILSALPHDVYMRRDSLKIFVKEILNI
jgi:hypothetical protein